MRRASATAAMFVSFYLLHRSDDVDVYIVDQTGTIVRTIALGRHMRRKVRTPDGVFTWNGRNDNGSVVPDGDYYIRVALIHQGRTVEISNSAGPEPVTVRRSRPARGDLGLAGADPPERGAGVTIRVHRQRAPQRRRADLTHRPPAASPSWSRASSPSGTANRRSGTARSTSAPPPPAPTWSASK